MHGSESMQKRIEDESWEYISHLAHSFHIELDSEDVGAKKLKKELCFVKHILHEHLCNPDDIENFLTTSLFVKMVEAIDKFEKTFDKKNIGRREFLFFLKAVLAKIRKEKLKAKKSLERKIELRKLKDAIENGHNKAL